MASPIRNNNQKRTRFQEDEDNSNYYQPGLPLTISFDGDNVQEGLFTTPMAAVTTTTTDLDDGSMRYDNNNMTKCTTEIIIDHK